MSDARLIHHEWTINPTLPPIPLTDVFHADGSLAARIEHYADPGPETTHAIEQFSDRMKVISSDLPQYRTVILDSVSFLQDAAVNYQRAHEVLSLAGNSDPRKWYALAKEVVKPELISRLAWIRDQNVVLVAHASEKTMEFSDDVVRAIDSIGKLPKDLGRAFGEVYHMRVEDERDGKGIPTGTKLYQLQTGNRGGWGAGTLIGVPDPCPADWNRLWDGGHPVKPLRCIVYGDFLTGKSRFASTWPGPLLILAFDPLDKLVHYERFAWEDRAT